MTWHFAQADAVRLPLADQSVDLTFGSPPYMDARTYGIGAQRDCVEWVEWMLPVLAEAHRVTRGPVLIVAAGVTRDFNYWPACEGLMWEWWKRGGDCQLYRPCFWNRVGIPGSGGKDWMRGDVEYVMIFKRRYLNAKGKPTRLPWSDNTACGHPPKWAPGGEMSYRAADGSRKNGLVNRDEFGSTSGPGSNGRRPDGTHKPKHKFGGGGTSFGRRTNGDKIPARRISTIQREVMHNQDQAWQEPVLANPGNYFEVPDDEPELPGPELPGVVKVIVGGGVMGSDLCHENEAPFPEALAEIFIKSLCPPGGRVLDMFSGSGTTVSVAHRLGRAGIGFDIRMNQCELGRRRLTEPAKPARAVAPPDPAQGVLFA